ncbi:YciI family protein [Ferrimonas pelagia]|uniref:YciI family protein n=1 Tax=Ferrimonas pelagia TaxID=1177826 RepID=A0ABP9FFY3_9GAMM
MWYMICSTDVANSLPLRKTAQTEHRARLQQLQDEGRLLTAGPLPAVDSNDPGDAGFTGSLVVAEFDSLEQAQAWADSDPYIAAGVYTGSVVKPYKRVFG